MTTYVAFQLGINVGKRQVKMAILKEVLTEAGFKNVRTLLASGNVVFDSEKKEEQALVKKLNGLMTEKFGFQIQNIVRSMDDIKKLIASDPFKNISVTPNTRRYVTFLTEASSATMNVPYETPEKDYKILSVTLTEVISVLTLSEKRKTTDAMKILGKEFGKTITTRNWNTILKIAAHGQ